ncbi:MAG TPA: hypothetical protein VN088_15030, partial [Nocardioides sp.]|nr:hypothetical protein [Nocardioides sp.]
AGPFTEPEQESQTRRRLMAGRVRAELEALMSAHPVADTLTELAVLLAETLDHPATRADPRAVATVVKELRATLADLVDAEANDDPLDLGDGVPTPVVVP